MQQEEREAARLLEFEPRLLALFLFISIPFILIGSLLILSSVRTELNRRSAKGLAEVAADTVRHLESYFLHNKTAVSMLAVTPTLMEGVEAANRRYTSEAAASDQLEQVDREWRELLGHLPIARQIVDNPMSEYLRQVTAFNPAYREILVTDRYGALVAATNVTTDYYQADEAWWQRAFGDGETGSIFLSTVLYDESVGAYAMEVAVPLRQRFDEGTSIVSGVLKALINAGDLVNVVGAVHVGETGHAFIVDASNRTVIAGDGPQDEATKEEYPGFNKLREAMADEQSSLVSQHPDGGIWLAGFSRMTSPIAPSDLEWYVIVEQSRDEAQAPAREATMYLLSFFGLMVLVVLLFSLYMHFRLVRPIRQVDLREEMDRLARATGTNG